ncbi:MAG: hypothetical protein PHP08_02685 [Candidatus Dojkabacteria bacterium]|nr:hypothetical protein [Candidatus Dojkabacteria bacterium]
MVEENIPKEGENKLKTLVIEGKDQCGKADATEILAWNLYEGGFAVREVSFPQYATPLGAVIRGFLSEGIQELDEIKGTRRELEVRMMMYALDRLQALDSILRTSKEILGEDTSRTLFSKKIHPWSNEDFLWLFDRSSFSNAVTIAYGLANIKDFNNEDISYLVNLGLSKEKYFIDRLGLGNCVIELVDHDDDNDEVWKPTRKEGEDQYETQEVQDRVDYVYSKYSEIIGEGWAKISTKDENGEWLDRKEINKKIMSFITERVYIFDLPKLDFPKSSLDIIDIARDIYGIDIIDISRPYWEAKTQNDKKTMYKSGQEVASYIVQNCEEVTIKDDGVKNAMFNILEEYPECLILLEHYYGEEFVVKFRQAIYD